MRQFYLYKNSSGYYNAIFVDPTSGNRGIDKSTHSKDQIKATMIATLSITKNMLLAGKLLR